MAQIQGDQILDGTVTDSDISATAAIQISKLQNGSRIPLKETNGDLILPGVLSLSGQKIENVASNTDSAGVPNYGQLTAAIATLNAAIASSQALCVLIANVVVNETPSGTVNGTNAAFTLANTPVSGKVLVFRNGQLQIEGGGEDYTISGATITFVSAPATGSKIRVTYIKA